MLAGRSSWMQASCPTLGNNLDAARPGKRTSMPERLTLVVIPLIPPAGNAAVVIRQSRSIACRNSIRRSISALCPWLYCCCMYTG